MSDEREEMLDAMLSAWRKLVPAMTAADGDSDKLEAVRHTRLTEREEAVMAPFLGELDEIIRRLREKQ